MLIAGFGGPDLGRFHGIQRVPSGDEKADDHLVKVAMPGELAVTADVPLTDRLVEKGLTAVNPRGDEYTPATIGERKAMRDRVEGGAW